VINADACDLLVRFAEITGVPVIPTLMGWGCIPDHHALMAGMVGLRTSHRYGNATFLQSDFVLGIGNSQIMGAEMLRVYQPRNWINCGQTGPLGWTMPAALGVRAADPTRKIVALSGDDDFQFMIEELAVGAQHKLPYLHVVVNNSYLGLIRQSQRGFQMDFEVSLAFENINSLDDPDAVPGYGVDHVAVAEGLGCKAIRVKSPNEFKDASARAEALMAEHQVPVVLEFILEKITNIAMGTEIDSVNEFEEILRLDPSLTKENGWTPAGARSLRDHLSEEKEPA